MKKNLEKQRRTKLFGNKWRKQQLYNSEDHKENFKYNPTVRLINSTKNELGHISMAILNTGKKKTNEKLWV